MKRLAFAALLCSASFVESADRPAAAQTAENFYKNTSTMRLIVGSSAGGGYDFYGRLVAKYLPRHLPGNPTIVVQNMPGAGGVTAANWAYNIAPRDGSVFANMDRGLGTAELFYGKDSKVKFEATKFNWIGSILKEVGVGVVASSAPVTTLDEAKKTELIVGVTGFESDPAMYARLFNLLAGTKFKTVAGYPGLVESMAAMERKELHAVFLSGWSGPNTVRAKAMHERGEVAYFVQMAREPHPDFGNTPTIFDVVTSPEDRQVINILLSRLELGRPFVLPPGVPEDRVALMRQAFMAASRDQDLIAEAEKGANPVDPVSGEEAQKIIQELYNTPNNVRDRLQKIVKF